MAVTGQTWQTAGCLREPFELEMYSSGQAALDAPDCINKGGVYRLSQWTYDDGASVVWAADFIKRAA